MSETQNRQEQDRLTWPRYRRDDGTPVVGWECQHCGEMIEHAYQPSLLKPCPNCGGNQQGVRRFEPEDVVEEHRERLFNQLCQHWGLDLPGAEDATCVGCGADDVHVCPGPQLDDLEFRCDDCRRFPKWWWQPGDHPSLLTRKWIETCERCGAEFTGLFGVTFWIDHGRGHETEDLCLRCADHERVRKVLEVY